MATSTSSYQLDSDSYQLDSDSYQLDSDSYQLDSDSYQLDSDSDSSEPLEPYCYQSQALLLAFDAKTNQIVIDQDTPPLRLPLPLNLHLPPRQHDAAPAGEGFVFILPPKTLKAAQLAQEALLADRAVTAYVDTLRHYHFSLWLADPHRGPCTRLYRKAEHIPEDSLLYIDAGDAAGDAAASTYVPHLLQQSLSPHQDTPDALDVQQKHRLATCKTECLQVYPKTKAMVGQPYSPTITDVRRLQINPSLLLQSLKEDKDDTSSGLTAAASSSVKSNRKTSRSSRKRRNRRLRREAAEQKQQKERSCSPDHSTTTALDTATGKPTPARARTASPPGSSFSSAQPSYQPSDTPGIDSAPAGQQNKADNNKDKMPVPEYVHVIGPLLVPSNRRYQGIDIGWAPEGFQETGFQVVVDVAARGDCKPVWIVYDYFPLEPESGTWRTRDRGVPVPLRNDTLHGVWPGLSRIGGASTSRSSPILFDVAMLMEDFGAWGTLSAEQMEQTLLSTATLRGLEVATIPYDDKCLLDMQADAVSLGGGSGSVGGNKP